MSAAEPEVLEAECAVCAHPVSARSEREVAASMADHLAYELSGDGVKVEARELQATIAEALEARRRSG